MKLLTQKEVSLIGIELITYGTPEVDGRGSSWSSLDDEKKRHTMKSSLRIMVYRILTQNYKQKIRYNVFTRVQWQDLQVGVVSSAQLTTLAKGHPDPRWRRT